MKKIVAAIVGIAVIVFLGYTHRDQATARFSCAEKLAHQYVTTQVVPGAYNCVTADVQEVLSVLYGVNNAADLALALGTDGATYNYLGETNDGGYTYRLDYAANPHNEVQAVWNDVKSFNFQAAWAEVNGETQGWVSKIDTFYLYPSGSTLLLHGKTYDVSGELEAIQ